MKIKKFLLPAMTFMPIVAFIACGTNNSGEDDKMASTHIKITSTSVDANGVLKDEFSKGSPRSLHLKWDAVKDATSYAVVMIDRDAIPVVGGIFIHWVVAGIETTELAENAAVDMKDKLFQYQNSTSKKTSNNGVVPDGFKQDEAAAYFGPYPPNKEHNYEITVVAFSGDNPFKTLDKKTPLFFSDFEKTLVAKAQKGEVLQTGTFYVVGKKPTDTGFEDVPAGTNNKFFKGDTYVEMKGISVDKHKGDKTDPNSLDSKYVAKLNETTKKYERSAEDKSPEISWNKVEGAKSYVMLLNNSNQIKAWGLPTLNWGVYGIAPGTGDKVTIAKNATGTDVVKEVINSYSAEVMNPIFPPVKDEVERAKWVDLGKGFGLANHGTETDTDGFYTVFVYATDLEPSAFDNAISDKATDGNITKRAPKNQSEILEVIKGHVLGQGQSKMKLKA